MSGVRNRLAAITAFLGGARNRYMRYHPDLGLTEKLETARAARGIDGVELCYPADFADVPLLKSLLQDTGLGVSAVNVRSRRDGKWLRGAFTSSSPAERAEVADEFKTAVDVSAELGVRRITTCPLNDGHDYPFELDYADAYRYAEEVFRTICGHDPETRISIEYKRSDPRTRSLFGSAGETLAFCLRTAADNLGITFDLGHSLQAGERPAQALVMTNDAGKLFYIHVNDNDRTSDWDLIPGSFHLWESVEFFYYLASCGYSDDWYAFDVTSKELDIAGTFSAAAEATRRLEELAVRIDRTTMDRLLEKRDPHASRAYLWKTLFPPTLAELDGTEFRGGRGSSPTPPTP